MSIVVMKFGGTSLGSEERIKIVAKKILKKKKLRKKVFVVVSAMGKFTNKLIDEYSKYSKCYFNPEYDVVLSAGEQISAGIIAAYLNERGAQTRSLLGWQAPINTDSFFGKARIQAINKNEILQKFDNNDVIVMAGFQGVTKDKRISTLGRGGSDTSAVAVAASLGAEVCEIYTDVDGIFTADPRDVKNAKKISKITYEEILEMSSLGSKVLQPRSVELAMKYDIKIHVRSSFKEQTGTLVVKEEKGMEKEVVTGISSSDDEAKITLIGIQDTPGVASRIFNPLAEANVNVDMIVQNITDNGKLTSLTFTVSNSECKKAVDTLKKSKIKFSKIHIDEKICKVSIVGVGMKSHVGVAKTMFESLAKKKINIQVISTSEIKISVLISKEKKKQALLALHKSYGLDKNK
ncbi:aspartate kinase [Rickettsiales bacterium]|nr:aspartate kinase [Rickettsiales bacterium]